MSRRKKTRGTLVGRLLLLVAAAVAAAVLWRWLESPSALPDTARTGPPTPAPALATPGGPAEQGSEEFSAAERRRLEDILRRKNGGAPR